MTEYRNRKLSAVKRLEILNRIEKGYTHAHIAAIYGVSRSRIGQIAGSSEDKVEAWRIKAALPPLEASKE